jgi:hypothetical protein
MKKLAGLYDMPVTELLDEILIRDRTKIQTPCNTAPARPRLCHPTHV